jgi:hypothetical protein
MDAIAVGVADQPVPLQHGRVQRDDRCRGRAAALLGLVRSGLRVHNVQFHGDAYRRSLPPSSCVYFCTSFGTVTPGTLRRVPVQVKHSSELRSTPSTVLSDYGTRALRICAYAAPTPVPTGTPAPTNVGDSNPPTLAPTAPTLSPRFPGGARLRAFDAAESPGDVGPVPWYSGSGTEVDSAARCACCGSRAGSYMSGPWRSNECPAGSERIVTEAACRTAGAAAGKTFGGTVTYAIYPRGCFYCIDSAYFNRDAVGAGDASSRLLCAAVTTGAPPRPPPMRARVHRAVLRWHIGASALCGWCGAAATVGRFGMGTGNECVCATRTVQRADRDR